MPRFILHQVRFYILNGFEIGEFSARLQVAGSDGSGHFRDGRYEYSIKEILVTQSIGEVGNGVLLDAGPFVVPRSVSTVSVSRLQNQIFSVSRTDYLKTCGEAVSCEAKPYGARRVSGKIKGIGKGDGTQ